VSGGPYGIEDMVSSFGPGMTLVLLLAAPLLWSLPVALAMSELAAALPDEGGYVTWTRRAFGGFWAFQVGWWSWIQSFVDVAAYPALFVEYVRFWRPAMTASERWGLVLVFVVVLSGLNLLGIRPTGRAAVVLAGLALAPVVAFTLVGLGAGRPLLRQLGQRRPQVGWRQGVDTALEDEAGQVADQAGLLGEAVEQVPGERRNVAAALAERGQGHGRRADSFGQDQ